MGKLLPRYNAMIIDRIVESITDQTAHYYLAGSSSIPYVGVVTTPSNAYADNSAYVNWNLLFGVKIKATDVAALAVNNRWQSGQVYGRWDPRATSFTYPFFVVVDPTLPGGDYQVFICVDNNGQAESTEQPDQIITTTFEKDDGYKWRYLYSISDADYTRFANDDYVPVFANSTVQSSALDNSTVDAVDVVDPGSGYATYHSGVIRSVINTTSVQIATDANSQPNFYTNSAIYVFNDATVTGQLRTISNYTVNTSGNYITLESAANTDLISPFVTQYSIAPAVVFDTDGDADPKAYCTVNTTANTIESVTVIDGGAAISRAAARIVANSAYGTGASLYCLAPPAKGFGADNVNLLQANAIAFNVTFANSVGGTIPTDLLYNKIAIYDNPQAVSNTGVAGATFTANSFNNVYKATISPSISVANGSTIVGNTTASKAVIVTANSTVISFVGDQTFEDGEWVNVANSVLSTAITITHFPQIATKPLQPLYVNNLNNIQRAAANGETFKLVIQT